MKLDEKHLIVIADAMKNLEKLAGSALEDLEGGYEKALKAAAEEIQEDHR